VNRLETQLARLVEQQVLSAAQAWELADAARTDQLDGRQECGGSAGSGGPVGSAWSASPAAPRSSAVLEVLGYVGGALVLGAVIMLGTYFWDDLGNAGRKGIAVASFVVPAVGGAALVRGRTRPELGRILLALACYAAGFGYLVVFEDEKFVVSTAIVVLTSAIGGVLLRSGAFLLSGWSGAMLLVDAIVFEVIEARQLGDADSDAWPTQLAIGFLLVGLIVAASGLVLSRTLAWSLAGISGWAASIALQAAPDGEWPSMIVATVVSGALLTAFVITHRYAYAVIGCLILLTIWPASLYQILGNDAVGAAMGLVAAGAVLIATVVVLSRRRRISSVA
jgi:Predicted membrane protein (DUF2157)